MHLKKLLLILLSLGLWGVSLGAFVSVAADTPPQARRFEFALIGDLQYSPQEEKKFLELIEDINRNPVQFTIHDGDFKSGGSPCTDAVFQNRLKVFQRFKQPFIFIFGDNEWTDCHRSSAGGFDPIERLAKLRELFTKGNRSLGQQPLILTRQGDIFPEYSKFRENVFWTYQGIAFVGLHLVGSNNNLGRNAENDAEYAERNAANLVWLKAAFARAKRDNSSGLVIIMQANPGFELPADKRTGFNDFIKALQAEILAYKQPIILVHGDSHYFRIDKPLNTPQGTAIANFTRVETFGTPNMHWLRVTVNPSNPNLFEFNPVIVP
jgi:hypothetical protein